MANEELLASWNDTATRQRIVDFVARVTTDGPDFVAPPDRVATFDNDGTLWCEKPLPIQLAFILQQLAEQADHRRVVAVETTVEGGLHARRRVVERT